MAGRGGKTYSTDDEKVAWLKAHPAVARHRIVNGRVAPPCKKRIVAAMKKYGLIAPSTYYLDVNLKDVLERASADRVESPVRSES